MALIYALLDGTPYGKSKINLDHLQAAFAVWDYCDKSAQFIFGDALGDPIADAVLRDLRNAGSDGLTRTELTNAYGRHGGTARLNHALKTLLESKTITVSRQQTLGRPVERFHISLGEKAEKGKG